MYRQKIRSKAMEKNKNNVAEEIIANSGNGFHSKVVNLLRELKWNVLVSPYYSDNFTDKPRELDIIAEKKFDVSTVRGWLGTLSVRVFIECKYINSDTVFWLDNKDKNRATERIMSDTGMRKDYDVGIEEHHYYSDSLVAKLFSSNGRGEDNEPINKAINQNLNALIYYRNRYDLMPEERARQNQVLRYISYPLIVVNSYDRFFNTKMSDNTSTSETVVEPFQLEVNYAYVDREKKGRNEYFLIDVVCIDKLKDFLVMLESTDIVGVKTKLISDERQNQSQNINYKNPFQ